MFISVISWQSQETKLTLHFENGFSLHSMKTLKSSDKPPMLWNYPYEKLRMSADDGQRLLWLDFGDEGEQVSLTSIVGNVTINR